MNKDQELANIIYVANGVRFFTDANDTLIGFGIGSGTGCEDLINEHKIAKKDQKRFREIYAVLTVGT